MKRPWAFICASEGATSKHLRNYCREVYLIVTTLDGLKKAVSEGDDLVS